MSTAMEEILAAQAAERERELEASRKRTVLFALESISGDGYPRVSAYTCEWLLAAGLIERVVADKLDRFQVTAEGRILLHTNPPDGSADNEPALFGSMP